MEGSFALGLPLLVVILVVVLALVFGRRGRFFMGSSRRLHHRHIVTRIVCAALGVGILVATGIGTWRDVRAIYEPATESGAGKTVRIPTMPAPQLSEISEGMAIKDCRLLAFLAVGDLSSGNWEPFEAREFEINWPADQGKTFALDTVVDGTQIRLSCTQLGLRRERTGPLQLSICNLNSRFEPGGSAYSGGRLAAGAPLFIHRQISARRPVNPLSILGSAPPRTVGLATFFVPVAKDDPLKEVSGQEFAEWYRSEIAYEGAAKRHATSSGAFRASLNFQPVRGLVLMAHIGLSSLLLVVAAVLLAQIFKRRGLAFAGVLTLVILFVAVLDYSVLDTHLEHLNDTGASLTTRTTACRQAAGSFFYSDTALREIEAVAASDQTPKMLRNQARQVAHQLRRSRGEPVPPPLAVEQMKRTSP